MRFEVILSWRIDDIVWRVHSQQPAHCRDMIVQSRVVCVQGVYGRNTDYGSTENTLLTSTTLACIWL